jgi:hypothetical protein
MKKLFIFSFIFLFTYAIDAQETDLKVCAFEGGKIKLSPPIELKEKLDSLNCIKGDKVVVFQEASWGNGIIRNKLIGAQICNLEKPHTINSQGGKTNNHHVICEYTGTVLDIVTNDKFFEKAF